MSLDIKGDERLHLQTGASITENDDGTLTGTAVFIGAAKNEGFRPRMGDSHPFNPKCEVTSVSLETMTNERVKVVCSYFGISNDTRRVSYTAGVAAEDVQLHPDFEKFAGTHLAPKNGARFQETTTTIEGEDQDPHYEFLGFFNGKTGNAEGKDSLVGTSNYLTPSGTVEVSYYTSREPKMKRLATIHNSVKGWKKPDGVANVLLTDMPYRQIGRSHYQVTETYLASDERGWNPKLYKKGS